MLWILDIQGLGKNPVLAASPCSASGKLLLHAVIFEEERKVTKAHV